MRMEPTDIADVTGATYHFLINGQTPAGNEALVLKKYGSHCGKIDEVCGLALACKGAAMPSCQSVCWSR